MTTHPKDPIAILPLGAHEQHGPHLPFQTDGLIAQGVVERLKTARPAYLNVTFLPVEPVGYSPEHMDVAGTKTLTYRDAIERWLSIAGQLAGSGTRKLILLNAHGGNAPLMTIVATGWTRFGVPEGVVSPQDKAIDIHGGDIETSVMLALHPELVDMAKAKNFLSRQSEFIARFTHLRAYGPHAFGWKMSDLNVEGAAGDASSATAEKGERLIAHAVKGLVELIEDVDGFDIRNFS